VKTARRWTLGALVGTAALVGLAACGGDSGNESASGQPCVKAKGLPKQAPSIDIRKGRPLDILMYRDIAPGDGASVGPESTVTVEYIGVACSTGKVFATSYVRSEPATYQMNGVIPGWREGLEGMRVGGRRLLSVPPRLAYGDKGLEPDIAPGETLWFVVDLMEVQNP